MQCYQLCCKTKHHFKVQICELLGISHLAVKKVKIDNNKLTTIQEHLLCCNYSPSYEDFSVLTRESNDFKLKIMEILLIAFDKPCLNKVDFSLLLGLFWYNISGYYMMFYHIIDVHRSHYVYTIVVCLVFNIMLQFLYLIKNRIHEYLISL